MEFNYEVPMSVEIDLENFIEEYNLSIDNIDKEFNHAFNDYMEEYDDIEYYTRDYIRDRVRKAILTILQNGKKNTL